MNRKQGRFWCLLTAGMMMVSFASCAKREALPPTGPEPSHREPEIQSEGKPQAKPSEEPHKTFVKYPQFVPEKVENHPLYKAASQKENAVILTSGEGWWEVVTGPEPYEDFLRKTQAGQPAELLLYNFHPQEEGIRCALTALEFDGKNYSCCEKDLLSAEEDRWQDRLSYGLTKVRTEPRGIFYLESDQYSPCFYQLMNDRDIIPDYDRMEELNKKYVSPIWYGVQAAVPFESPEDWGGDIFTEVMVSMVQCSTGQGFWDRFPDGKITVPQIMDSMNQYIPVEEATVRRKLSRWLDGDVVTYLGGRGGAYPRLFVVEQEQEGNRRMLHIRRSDVNDGQWLDPDLLLTVEDQPDGSFRYLSLKQQERS